MFFRRIYDDQLAQAAYIIGCQKTGEAMVIDPQRDVDRYITLVERNGLRITAIAETHIHADFLSGSRELAERTGAKLYLSGEGGEDWKYQWLDKKNDGGYYLHQLIYDGDSISVGNVEVKTVHTPGHTPEHVSFMVTDHGSGVDDPIGIVTGDFVFVGDVGRPDLLEKAAGQEGAMEPAAIELHDSLQWFDRLDDYLQVWPGHGAGSACGKALGSMPSTTVGYEKRFNPALEFSRKEENEFVNYVLDGQPDPPSYFARMKKENKEGPALLNSIPNPSLVAPGDIVAEVSAGESALIDTREWADFRVAHMRGSYHIPNAKNLSTIAASYIQPDQKIYLAASPDDIESIVLALVRVGLDNVAGYVMPEALTAYVSEHGNVSVEIVSTAVAGLAAVLRQRDVHILDVRGESEFQDGHARGAINVAHTRLSSSLDEIPNDELIYVHCQAGGRAAIATSYLQAKGKNVIYVGGKFAEFEQAGVPVE